MMTTAILSGIFAVGGSIFKSIRAAREREAQRAQLEKQKKNLQAVKEFKQKIFEMQKNSLESQYKNQQKAITMSQEGTKLSRDANARNSSVFLAEQNKNYNLQLKQANMQALDAMGATTQSMATTGFRKSEGTSVDGILKKQEQVNQMSLQGLENSIYASKAQAVLNAASAHDSADNQITVLNEEKRAQTDAYNHNVAIMNEQNTFEQDQIDAQLQAMDEDIDYLGDYSNFVLDDILNIGGSMISSGLNIAGTKSQMDYNDEVMAANKKNALDSYAMQEYIAKINANAQMKANGVGDEYMYDIKTPDILTVDTSNANTPKTYGQFPTLQYSNRSQLFDISSNLGIGPVIKGQKNSFWNSNYNTKNLKKIQNAYNNSYIYR